MEVANNQEISKEILRQLGGNRFIAMTGARNFISSKHALSFKVMRNSAGITHIVVTLNALDLYDLEFLKINVRQKIVKALRFDVYNEDLQRVFTDVTGLDTYLYV